YKVFYQPTTKFNPRRENTQSLYIESVSEVIARSTVEEQTDYNIEYLEELSPKALEYEQQNPDFKITEFNNEEA
ncbi:MAG: DNA-directed RNA polymerase subunit epsilon, partial [Liquorilactobacillus hordei]